MAYANVEDAHSACKQHYRENRQRYLDRNVRHRIEIRRKLQEYKATIKCARCPESDPRCLDFHHLDADKKTYDIGQACTRTTSWKSVLVEIRKCIPLCANCHRKETISLPDSVTGNTLGSEPKD